MIMTDRMEEKYKLLVAQVVALLEGETHVMAVLSNVSAALHDAFLERFFWVGFYMVHGEELLLGPFQGPVACYHIGYGKGVCGLAWQRGETVIVPDVEQFPGHIACSSRSRSEIVVPIHGGDGSVKGVIDIDSTDLDAFGKVDRMYLEQIAVLLSRQLNL
ncbi:putative GAF domain-containing protein A [Hallella bergensis DSM 17361]|uniref:Putative GAF domain-containing protein A n=1 Tax=Hallella bergensis DSM 17361 TaxID=585502 RepID=D1PXA5_9BACT|nr:GAF domain-containing protein [Hallella bergensis]EFA43989.1 putative GAF domain-containing protein A [Hallella bergensis DSM 17361]